MSDILEINVDDEAEEMVPPMIIFHGECPDGMAAMTMLNNALGGGCELVEGYYGQDPPEVTGRHVWMVDFSYPRDVMEKLWVVTESLSVIDHHKTAAEQIDWAVGTIDEAISAARHGEDFVWLDMEQSGAGMVARLLEQLFDDWEAPEWAWSVEDRDLWRFDIPGTREVVAALTSHPYTYEAWEQLLAVDLMDLVIEGAAIERYREQLISLAIKTAYRAVLPTGHEVWVACCPYSIGSDVAGRLAEDSEEGWAAYYVNYGHRVKYGLRSAGKVNVREIAELVPGGGGHDAASGFESDMMPSPI